jgi:23S rRNA (adenine1618-N6)-methyltransferase
MINESFLYQSQVLWFTCLVSKKIISQTDNAFKKVNADYKIVDMAQGQ